MTTVLIGGGWDAAYASAGYGPFLEAAGGSPSVGCVIVDEGDGADYFERFRAALTSVAPCDPVAVLVPVGTTLSPTALDEFDAVLVCGGLTPAYVTAVAPVAAALRSSGRPYAGFSAGAAIAASRAVVGGYLLDGQVCPSDAAEDLDDVTVVDGLGWCRSPSTSMPRSGARSAGCARRSRPVSCPPASPSTRTPRSSCRPGRRRSADGVRRTW